MTRPVAARGGRMLGRGLLTVANVITVAAPFAADWNDSHIFNERWPAHARFHGVTALAMAATLSSLNIWSIWSSARDRTTARFFAAAIPVAYRAPFFVAPLVPGTAVDDPPHPVPRLAGVPTNLLLLLPLCWRLQALGGGVLLLPAACPSRDGPGTLRRRFR